ncbi:hypothetical protein L6452_40488 [Arctium lappa]|uniref:Uncharacterized protein n=1 Tax=Arctium lappa TaxID=4217 RepID=A0ACB8XN75_ARCLA|nr:hypothetical protein L6452_40488 [Arctium lappa]
MDLPSILLVLPIHAQHPCPSASVKTRESRCRLQYQLTTRKLNFEKLNLVEVFEDLSRGMMSNSAVVLCLIVIVDVPDGVRRCRRC